MVISVWVCFGGVKMRPDFTHVVAPSKGCLCKEKGSGLETKVTAPVDNKVVVRFILAFAGHSLNPSVDF